MRNKRCAAIALVAALSLGVFRCAAAETVGNGEHMLVVGTKEAPPFVIRGKDGGWSGIAIDLWRRIAEQEHLAYRFEETSLPGLTEGTASGRLDAAVAALTVTAERERMVDFTLPFYETGLGIAVPHAAKFDWLRLLGSLGSAGFLEVLGGLIAMTLLIGVIVWLIERPHTEHFGGVRRGLSASVWWSALALIQSTAEHAPMTGPGRLIAVVWISVSVGAFAVFTAGVSSQLTARQLQGIVHGVNDLYYVRVGAVADTASLAYLDRRRIRFRTYPNVQAGLSAIASGTLDAFVYDRPILAWVAREQFTGTVDVLDATFDKQNYAIALPLDSKLRRPIDLALLELLRTPWWEELTARYLGRE
jgi:ABC-type amino acid transport substrate-binding protein